MLTPEREAEIRHRIKVADAVLAAPSAIGRPVTTPVFWCDDARDLLAEIDALRPLRAQVEALKEALRLAWNDPVWADHARPEAFEKAYTTLADPAPESIAGVPVKDLYVSIEERR